MARKKKQEWLTFTENGKKYMQCKHCHSEYVVIGDDDVEAVYKLACK